MAICLVCRFYGYTLGQIGELTLAEFKILSDNMVKIIEMENPTPEREKAKPLTSASLAGFTKKKKKKRDKK